MAETKARSETHGPLGREDRLELANRMYREFHARCFWHCPRDLVITEDLIPMVVKGFRLHGGRQGSMLSGQLREVKSTSQGPPGEGLECR